MNRQEDIAMTDSSLVQTLLAQVNELQRQVGSQPQPAEHRQNRETYKINEQYDHSQPSLWPQFELKLRAKLQIDGNVLGDDERKIYRLFAYLSGVAAQRALPWIENYAANSTVGEFLDHLRATFGDPTREKKALTRLNTLRQGKKTFAEFIPEFDQVLIEAGAGQWQDRAKVGFLQAAINLELRERLVGLPQSTNYVDYCTQLREVSQQLEELSAIKSRSGRYRGRDTKPGFSTQGQLDAGSNAPGGDQMDWEPTQAVRLNASAPRQRPRARIPGVSEEVIQDRVRHQACLRCGRTGHRHRQCLEAVNPGTTQGTRGQNQGSRTQVLRGKPAPEANSRGETTPEGSDGDDSDQGKD